MEDDEEEEEDNNIIIMIIWCVGVGRWMMMRRRMNAAVAGVVGEDD